MPTVNTQVIPIPACSPTKYITADGTYLGETWSGLTDEHKIHYDTKGYAGDGWGTLLGTDTELFDGDLTDLGDDPF